MGRDSVSRYNFIIALLLAKAAISVHKGWCPSTVLLCLRFVYWLEDVVAHAVLWHRVDN